MNQLGKQFMSELDINNFVEQVADNIDTAETPVLNRKRGPAPKNRNPRITGKVRESYETQTTLGVTVPGNMSGLLGNYIRNGARDLGLSVQLSFTFEGNDGSEVTTIKSQEVPKDSRQVLLRFQGRDKQRRRASVSESDSDELESS